MNNVFSALNRIKGDRSGKDRKMERKWDAICIGYVTQDILLTNIPEDALKRDASVADTAMISFGGDAGNQAVALSRLGSRTALLVHIGTDSIGESVYGLLKKEPVDRSLILRKEEYQIMLSVVVVKPDGERSFLVRNANQSAYPAAEEITDEILKNTRAVTIGSLFCLPGLDGLPMAGVLKRAQNFGVLTFCDMTLDIMKIGPEAISCVYPYIDYMIPSMEEARYCTGKSDPDEIADYFLSRGVKNLVLKLGSRGCFFKNEKKRFITEAFPVKAVDTTGCGDTFLGAFTHGILENWEEEKAARFACAAGAINATQLGAHSAVQNEGQVLSFMEKPK